MEKAFKTDDIRKLYSAFISLCDYIEENAGCGNCPLWLPMCGNKSNEAVRDFSEALERIRETADIQKP
ncbi:MAG: hypothetical protein MJ074_05535 [Oscillospiraceae bacterium]|nr:hypothetical protein [Oscillospiraceae bacterium]